MRVVAKFDGVLILVRSLTWLNQPAMAPEGRARGETPLTTA
jgi:hypothetical protein